MAPAIAAVLRIADLSPVVRAACVVFLCQGFSMVAQASAQRALRFRASNWGRPGGHVAAYVARLSWPE